MTTDASGCILEREHMSALADLVATLHRKYHQPDVRPVLAAEGDRMVIEIVSGSRKDRTLHRRFDVRFDRTQRIVLGQHEHEDAQLVLPNVSYVIAMLSMLELAFGNPVSMDCPRNAHGLPLRGWPEARGRFRRDVDEVGGPEPYPCLASPEAGHAWAVVSTVMARFPAFLGAEGGYGYRVQGAAHLLDPTFGLEPLEDDRVLIEISGTPGAVSVDITTGPQPVIEVNQELSSAMGNSVRITATLPVVDARHLLHFLWLSLPPADLKTIRFTG